MDHFTRCVALDGLYPAAGALISALRVLGGVATYDALYGELIQPRAMLSRPIRERSAQSAVQHAVARLRRRGRVLVREPDGGERLLVLREEGRR